MAPRTITTIRTVRTPARAPLRKGAGWGRRRARRPERLCRPWAESRSDRGPVLPVATATITESPTPSLRVKAVNRGAKRLLVYVLDVPATLCAEPDRDRPGAAPAPTGRRLGSAETVVAFAGSAQAKYDPEDRDLLALLEDAQTPRRRRPPRRRHSPLRRPPPCSTARRCRRARPVGRQAPAARAPHGATSGIVVSAWHGAVGSA